MANVPNNFFWIYIIRGRVKYEKYQIETKPKKFTLESGLIYLNSLLRSTILYAAETMYNEKENKIRQLERNEHA